MKNKKVFKSFLILLLSLAILSLIFCTKNKPTQYVPKIYRLFVHNGVPAIYGGGIYTVDTNDDTFADTIHLDYPGWIAVSPDGASLHMARLEGDTINGESDYYYIYYEFDTQSKSIKYKGPHGGITITPNGKYLFHGMNIVDSKTHQLVHSDTIQAVAAIPVFDRNAPLVYVGLSKRGMIGVFNYDTFTWVRFFEIILKISQTPRFLYLLVSPDGKTLFFVAQIPVSIHGIFGAYDLINDSLLVEFVVNSDLASLAVTRDGKYVYISDPGSYSSLVNPSTGNIEILDTETNSFLPPIRTDSIETPDWAVSYIDKIVIHPTQDKAYVSTWACPVILVIDTKNNTIADTIMFSTPPGVSVGMLAIQTKP